MRRPQLLGLILILTLSALPLAAQKNPPQARSSAAASEVKFGPLAEQITAAQLKDYLSFIAADELEGRDTPSRGLNIAAKFIATNLSRWGLKPAGDEGSYFQKITLQRAKFDAARSQVAYNGQNFRIGEDFLAQSIPGNVSGPLVYVGHGWVIKSKQIDSYAGIDVRDKIIVVSDLARPQGINNQDLHGVRGVDWDSPVSYALSRGAKAIINVPSFHELSSWDRARRNLVERGVLSPEDKDGAPPSTIPVITPSTAMLTALFRGEPQSGREIFNHAVTGKPGPSFALNQEKRIDISISLASEEVATQNVVAIAEGSDPALKSEYVALGAHYDHVGTGTPVGGDAIYNGADDDGSGTVALLAMAETLARNPRPKRSILFVWHTGEEKGLWGSEHFTRHPTVPLAQIIAQLNVDMIGRSKKDGDTNPVNRNLTGPHEIHVIGSRMMSTELGELSERVNRSYLNLTFNYRYDDPRDPERFFFRSDHYNYAIKGIPIIFYFDGVHEDYHRPGDSADKIDYPKLERVARTIFATAWTLANTPTRPRVDKELPAELKGNRT